VPGACRERERTESDLVLRNSVYCSYLTLLLTLFSRLGFGSDRPTPPKGSTILEQTNVYIIYETKGGERKILFDSRAAMTNFLSNHYHGNDEAVAILVRTPAAGVVVHVVEGRHRAVGASQGAQISMDQGGTRTPFWLDYDFGQVRPVSVFDDPDERPLSEFRLPGATPTCIKTYEKVIDPVTEQEIPSEGWD
jgi:hypothetical protein